MSNKTGYYYLHTNGDLIFKNAIVGSEADFTESDFVKAYWFIDPAYREDAWTVLVEALAFGAEKERIMTLAKKWKCDDTDAQKFAEHINIVIDKDGDEWCAHFKNFANIQESLVGFGETALEAIAELAQKSPINRSGPWSLMSLATVASFNS